MWVIKNSFYSLPVWSGQAATDIDVVEQTLKISSACVQHQLSSFLVSNQLNANKFPAFWLIPAELYWTTFGFQKSLRCSKIAQLNPYTLQTKI